MEKKKNEIQEDMDITPKVYEVGYLLLPSLAEENLAQEVALIKAVVEKNNGTFISEDFPKLRNLTYTMSKLIDTKKQKFDKGYFGWVKFEVPATALVAIKATLEANPHVLRFLLINTVKENTLVVPKVLMPKKVEGEEAQISPEDGGPVVAIASSEDIDKSIEELVIN